MRTLVSRVASVWSTFVLIFAVLNTATLADTIELADGTTVQGEIVEEDDQAVTIRVTAGDRTMTRRYTRDLIKSIVRSENDAAEPGPSEDAQRSPEEVRALIEEVGRTKPAWWDSTELDYPPTLDLSWPMPPPSREWNNQRNVGQYLWDVIYPNPGRWHQGARLLTHIMSVQRDNPAVVDRAMKALANLYYRCLEDYARAAFWWQQAGVDDDPSAPAGVNLAECYWRLGSKSMALSQLESLDPPRFPMIKLYGDMGQYDKALRMAAANVDGPYADMVYLMAGDVYRQAGDYEKALQCYELAADKAATGQGRRGQREMNQQRALANIRAIEAFEMFDLSSVPDGTYQSSSPGYTGPVQVEVVVEDHRITAVRVARHAEKQFYSSLTAIPERIVAKQHVKGIDAVSGATITSEAIVNAVAKALAEARQQ